MDSNLSTTLTTEEKQSLLHRLNSPWEKVSTAAREEIQDTQKYPFPMLLQLVEEERKQMKHRVRIGRATYCVLFAMWIPAFLSRNRFVLLIPLHIIAFISTMYLRTHSVAFTALIRLAMSKHNDIQVLPYLLEDWGRYGVDKELDWAPQRIFIHLLGQLRTQDVPLLQTKHREVLNRCLLHREDSNPFLKVAILKAYQQIGDAYALKVVEILLERGSSTQPAVYQAAEECLPYLQQNVERVTEMQTLLRASSPTEKQEELLRPLQAEEPEAESLLLRPSEKTP